MSEKRCEFCIDNEIQCLVCSLSEKECCKCHKIKPIEDYPLKMGTDIIGNTCAPCKVLVEAHAKKKAEELKKKALSNTYGTELYC